MYRDWLHQAGSHDDPRNARRIERMWDLQAVAVVQPPRQSTRGVFVHVSDRAGGCSPNVDHLLPNLARRSGERTLRRQVLLLVRRVTRTRNLAKRLTMCVLANGNHQTPANRELLRQRWGDTRPRRRDQDGIKGGCLGPAARAVADAQLDISIVEFVEARLGGVGQRWISLDCIDSPGDLAHNRGRISGTCAYLQHLLSGSHFGCLNHHGDDVRLRDRLTFLDRQRRILVRKLLESRRDKELPRHRAHGRKDARVSYTASLNLNTHHSLTRFGEICHFGNSFTRAAVVKKRVTSCRHRSLSVAILMPRPALKVAGFAIGNTSAAESSYVAGAGSAGGTRGRGGALCLRVPVVNEHRQSQYTAIDVNYIDAGPPTGIPGSQRSITRGRPECASTGCNARERSDNTESARIVAAASPMRMRLSLSICEPGAAPAIGRFSRAVAAPSASSTCRRSFFH